MKRLWNNILYKWVWLSCLLVIVLVCASCDGSKTVTTPTLVNEELSASEIVDKVSPVVAHILGYYGAGTGIVIDSKGYILTNYHIVENEDDVIVILPDREEMIAEIVYTDSYLDIAILKCPGAGYPFIPLGSTEVSNLGDDVIVIGYPLSTLLGDTASISKGVISAFRTIDGIKYIQTDAPANPGSSGGPLVNNYAEVIGIVSWGIAETEGMNFAIDANDTKAYIEDVLEQLIQGGISVQTVTKTITETETIATTKTVTMTVTMAMGSVVTITVTDIATLTVSGDTTTVTITEATSPSTTPEGNVVFTFTGVGERNTLPFSISTSPWIFQCRTSWSGNFTIQIYSESSGYTGNTKGVNVIANEAYEDYMYNITGSDLYFDIVSAPADGEWTVSVIELS